MLKKMLLKSFYKVISLTSILVLLICSFSSINVHATTNIVSLSKNNYDIAYVYLPNGTRVTYDIPNTYVGYGYQEYGNNVSAIQAALIISGCNTFVNPKVQVDGCFGPITYNAIYTFQVLDNDLDNDGIAGPITGGQIMYAAWCHSRLFE